MNANRLFTVRARPSGTPGSFGGILSGLWCSRPVVRFAYASDRSRSRSDRAVVLVIGFHCGVVECCRTTDRHRIWLAPTDAEFRIIGPNVGTEIFTLTHASI
jgi:hypothetical protein